MVDVMGIYYSHTGGMRPRICANLFHDGGVPADDNATEAMNKSAHAGVPARNGTALHGYNLQGFMSTCSRLDVQFTDNLRQDLWSGVFFKLVWDYTHISLYPENSDLRQLISLNAQWTKSCRLNRARTRLGIYALLLLCRPC